MSTAPLQPVFAILEEDEEQARREEEEERRLEKELKVG